MKLDVEYSTLIKQINAVTEEYAERADYVIKSLGELKCPLNMANEEKRIETALHFMAGNMFDDLKRKKKFYLEEFDEHEKKIREGTFNANQCKMRMWNGRLQYKHYKCRTWHEMNFISSHDSEDRRTILRLLPPNFVAMVTKANELFKERVATLNNQFANVTSDERGMNRYEKKTLTNVSCHIETDTPQNGYLYKTEFVTKAQCISNVERGWRNPCIEFSIILSDSSSDRVIPWRSRESPFVITNDEVYAVVTKCLDAAREYRKQMQVVIDKTYVEFADAADKLELGMYLVGIEI